LLFSRGEASICRGFSSYFRIIRGFTSEISITGKCKIAFVYFRFQIADFISRSNATARDHSCGFTGGCIDSTRLFAHFSFSAINATFDPNGCAFNPISVLQLYKPDSLRVYVEALQRELPVGCLRRMVDLLPQKRLPSICNEEPESQSDQIHQCEVRRGLLYQRWYIVETNEKQLKEVIKCAPIDPSKHTPLISSYRFIKIRRVKRRNFFKNVFLRSVLKYISNFLIISSKNHIPNFPTNRF